MITITNSIPLNIKYDLSANYNTDELIFFDIETTGFMVKNTVLYLIGYAVIIDDQICITQLFNNDGNSEIEMITFFNEKLKKYKYLFSFCGDSFDLNYLSKRSSILGLDFSHNNISSVDIYKIVNKYKKVLNLDNLKQKSIEKFLHIERIDKLSGKELITVYKAYIQSQNPIMKKTLLQHNYDDVLGLIEITDFFNYENLFHGNIKITKYSLENNFFNLYFEIENDLSNNFNWIYDSIIISFENNVGRITIPVKSLSLKYFYPNYKNYYFLPLEDTAIHKSVGAYVSKEFRQNATPSNCYIKKKGEFLPQYEKIYEPEFKKEYKDKYTYFEVELEKFSDLIKLNSYGRSIFNYVIKNQ